ncbi:MAG: serine hydrolase, partial [Clostridia bacterium]|nr:serine hydrolase [Clostridia bacterium]
MAVGIFCCTLTAHASENYIYDVSDGQKPFAEDDSVWIPTAAAVSEAALAVGGKSAVLLEQATGEMLFAKNAHDKLPIASVTKIMTLLLVMEALDSEQIKIDETVVCSKTAASMGGS